MGTILAINISVKKGIPKKEIDEALFKENFGIIGDAHGGAGHRQISLLANESIDKIRDKITAGLCFGRFAENLTVSGIEIWKLEIGSMLRLGEDVILKVTQIGKECHNDCEIKKIAGDCVMPREGVFATVEKGGLVKKNDTIICI